MSFKQTLFTSLVYKLKETKQKVIIILQVLFVELSFEHAFSVVL